MVNRSLEKLLLSVQQQLIPVSSTPRLDAEVLLTHAIDKPREFLFTHPEYVLTHAENTIFEKLINQRMQGEPIAYIQGHKEFWSLDLQVTQDTLIPRPETELLVEWLLRNLSINNAEIADLGTGSGAIAIALAYERPHWHIDACDLSVKALDVAKSNAKKYQLNNINFYCGDWCDALPEKKYAAIVANPPYVAHSDFLQSPVLHFEPSTALDGGEDGLSAIKKIICQAKNYLLVNGILIFEHGYDQGDQVQHLLLEAGYQEVQLHYDLANLPRFTQGKHL